MSYRRRDVPVPGRWCDADVGEYYSEPENRVPGPGDPVVPAKTIGAVIRRKVDVDVLTEQDVGNLIQQVLTDADITLDQLQAQGRRGRFDSEVIRHACHVVKALGGFQ